MPQHTYIGTLASILALVGLFCFQTRGPAPSPVCAADVETPTLLGRIVDADSGQLLPARLYIRSKGGQWHFADSTESAADPANGPPTSKASSVHYRKKRGPNSLEMHTTLSAHPFSAKLPPGVYTLTAERGKEYLPVTKTITIKDKAMKIDLPLKRYIDMAKRGWYSGDTHTHRTMAELPNVIMAEDLNVALPLNYWVTDSRQTPAKENRNPQKPPPAKLIKVDPTHVIWPINTEYEIFTVNGKRHTLGAIFILNHQKTFEHKAPPVGPIAAEARKQGAILDLDKHNWPWSMMLIPIMKVDLYELTNNHIWRTEFMFSNWYPEYAPSYMNIERTTDGKGYTERGWVRFTLANYYTLLNSGFRLRPTAGTASGVHPVPLGFGRVYVHLPDGFSYDKWIKGLDAGHSFVTTGPLLTVNFNEKTPGHTFKLAKQDKAQPFEMHITGNAHNPNPLDRIEVIVNGRVKQVFKPDNRKAADGGYESPIDTKVKLDGSSWIALRCFEYRPGGRIRFAHTAPVHVDIAGSPLKPRRVEIEYLIKRITDEIERHRGVLPAESLAEYENALKIYRALLNKSRD